LTELPTDDEAKLTFGLMLIGSFEILYKFTGQKLTMPGCQSIAQRRHVELVANSEIGNTGLKKGPSLHALRG